jgi:hypothetical protein
MADITMCDNQKCEIRGKCYRAKAEPSEYQSWAIFGNRVDEFGQCENFVEFVMHDRSAEKAVDF